MKWFNNLNIASKILVAFILISLITGFLGFSSYSSMKTIMHGQEEIGKVRLPSVQNLLILSEAQTAVAVSLRTLSNPFIIEDEIREAQYDYMDAAFNRSTEAREIYDKLPQTKEEKQLWKEFVPQWDEWELNTQTIVGLTKEKDQLLSSGININDPQIQTLDRQILNYTLQDNRDLFLKAESTLNQVVDLNMKVVETTIEKEASEYSNATRILIIIIFVSILLSIILGIFISKAIIKPIKQTTVMLKDIAEGDGDLTKRLKIYSKDEIGILAGEFNNFIEKLHGIIKHVKGTAETTSEHANSIAVATEETAASVGEVSKAIEELASGASDQAKEATQSSQKIIHFGDEIASIATATDVIKEFTDDVQKVGNEGLNDINELSVKFNESNEITTLVSGNVESLADKSTSINQITNAIKAVADQTNLLALNAAIEAARAGEAGRGFAVVAEEIRKLAEQTTGSTKEIEEIITDIQKEISMTKGNMEKSNSISQESKKSFEKTFNAFNKIVDAVGDVIEEIDKLTGSISKLDNEKQGVIGNIEGIASIAEESAASTEEVSASVEEQSATIEDMARAAEELKQIANELNLAMGKFKL